MDNFQGRVRRVTVVLLDESPSRPTWENVSPPSSARRQLDESMGRVKGVNESLGGRSWAAALALLCVDEPSLVLWGAWTLEATTPRGKKLGGPHVLIEPILLGTTPHHLGLHYNTIQCNPIQYNITSNQRIKESISVIPTKGMGCGG